MIQGRMQQNRDHQRCTRTLYQGSKSNGRFIKATRLCRTSRRHSICLYPDQNGGCTNVIQKKIQSQNVQIFGYVNQNTSGQNHGPAWKSQSFLLSEICTVILWQDYYGKSISRKFYWTMVGQKFQIGNANL